MSITNDMNIVIGQGTAIKEVHNVKKQNLEINQQFIAQAAGDEKREKKTKVQEFDTENKVAADRDEKEGKNNYQKGKKKKLAKKGDDEDINPSGGNIIDIVV